MPEQRDTVTDIVTTDRNDIMGLRGLLMAEMRSLGPKASKEQLEIAKVKSELAQTIINSVKAEALFLQVAKKSNSRFIPIEGEVIPEEK
jgi:hypothetical protein